MERKECSPVFTWKDSTAAIEIYDDVSESLTSHSGSRTNEPPCR